MTPAELLNQMLAAWVTDVNSEPIPELQPTKEGTTTP